MTQSHKTLLDQQITLYGRLETGSASVEALLVELGVKFTLVEVEKSATPNSQTHTFVPDWFVNVNPIGQIPALVVGAHDRNRRVSNDQLVTESGAIMTLIGDAALASGKLAGTDLFVPELHDPKRNSYMRWMYFLAASTYNNSLMYFYSDRWGETASATDFVKARAKSILLEDTKLIESALAHQPYLLGDKCSPVDFYAAMLLSWSWVEKGQFPELRPYCESVFNRPKSKAIWTKHNGG